MTTKTPKSRWTEIYTQLQDDKIDFFLNTQLEPTVLIPSDGFQTEWPVDSQRFQDLLISIYFEITEGKLLPNVEREFLLAQIREECRRGGRHLTEVEAQETDKDAIVQAILSLMNRQEEFVGQTIVLVKELRGIQLRAVGSSESIPIFTNIFSRRLNRLIPVLRGYGVEVVMEHKESGSHCTLRKLASFQKEPTDLAAATDDFTTESSAESSGVTSRIGADLPPPDDADGGFRGDPPKSTNGASELKNSASTKAGGAK